MNAAHTRGWVAVGIDGSPEAVTAARYAVTLAQARHVDLLVVCAYQPPVGVAGMNTDMLGAARAAAEETTVGVVSQLTLPPTMRVSTLVELALPAPALCRVAETAAVLVIGFHHFNLIDQLLTGPVASPVAARAACPVVIVPRKWSRTLTGLGSIVVALDGETPATAVLDFAFAEAERSGCRVTALHALPHPTGAHSDLDPRSSLAEILAGHEQAHPDIEVRTRVVPGEPSTVITEESLAADLVVVGRPHHQRRGSWTRSVARAVLDQAHCPLVIVPADHIRSRALRPAQGTRQPAGVDVGASAE